MIKLEELPVSIKKFDCQENVNSLSCNNCGFSSQVLLPLIQHQEAWCENNGDNSYFLLDAYKCRNCEFVSCSCIITSAHERKCRMLNYASGAVCAWICSHCEFTISYKCDTDINNYECGYQSCNYASTRLEELKQHAIIVHLPDECLTFFFSNDGLEEKKSKQIDGCTCDQCGQEFKRKLELDRHVIYKHTASHNLYVHEVIKHTKTPEGRWFLCQHCEYKSKYKCNLRTHITNKHQRPLVVNIQWFECEECPYKSKSTSNLRSHKINNHTPPEKIKWFKCQECSYKTKTRIQLRVHKIYKHVPDESIQWFECQQCEHKNKTRSGLNRHMIYKHTTTENLRWYLCEVCPYKAKTKSDLNKHKFRKHTPVEEVNWFECQECPFKSKTRGYLNYHKNFKHNPTRPDPSKKCEKCGRKTKAKKHLTQA